MSDPWEIVRVSIEVAANDKPMFQGELRRLLADAEALLDFRQKATWLANNEADAFLREYLREALAALPAHLREQGEG